MHSFLRLQLFRPLFVMAACLTTPSVLADPGSITVPPNSFLTQHAESVPQLSRQVASNPVVRLRLARHFHLSSPSVLHYIQKNLVVKTLTTDSNISVYCLSATGHEYVVHSYMPAGTHVFALRTTGEPILKFSSGNPLVASLPGLTKNTAPILPKAVPFVRLAQLIKPTIKPVLPKVSTVKAKEEPIFVMVNSGPGLYIMPQKAKPAEGDSRK